MTKFKTERRSGVERRKFNYTKYIPERRSGKDRRIAKNGKEVPRLKLADELPKEEHQQLVHGKWLFKQLLQNSDFHISAIDIHFQICMYLQLIADEPNLQ